MDFKWSQFLQFVLCISLLASCSKKTIISGECKIGEEVKFTSGAYIISGSLLTPDTGLTHPAIIIINGSGSFSYRSYWALKAFGIWKQIATSFNDQGFAVLLLDKRGINESEGNWKKSNFFDRMDDVHAAANYLKSRNDIIKDKIGLCGHSQGGWIAQLTAATYPEEIAFIIMLAGPSISVKQQIIDDQRSEWLCDQLPIEKVNKKTKRMERRLSFYKSFSKLIKFNHLSRIIDYDPSTDIPKIKCPVLAVYAQNDELVLPETNIPILKNYLVARANQDYKILIIKGANHLFIEAEKCTPWSQLKPKFAPQFDSLLMEWPFLESFR